MHHDPRSPCLPPAQYQRYMGMHWLQVLDYDGHSFGNIALQWNPGSRTWTHSQAHDTHGAGGGIETTGYKWLAFIPQPPLTDDDFDPSERVHGEPVRAPRTTRAGQGRNVRRLGGPCT